MKDTYNSILSNKLPKNGFCLLILCCSLSLSRTWENESVCILCACVWHMLALFSDSIFICGGFFVSFLKWNWKAYLSYTVIMVIYCGWQNGRFRYFIQKINSTTISSVAYFNYSNSDQMNLIIITTQVGKKWYAILLSARFWRWIANFCSLSFSHGIQGIFGIGNEIHMQKSILTIDLAFISIVGCWLVLF